MSDSDEDQTSLSERAWTQRQKELREDEVRSQRRSADSQMRSAESQRRLTRFQALIAVAAIVAALAAVFAAGFAAVKADDAIDVAKEGIRRQGDENRLTAAIAAIGGDTSTQRVAGLTILRRHARQRLETALDGDEETRRDAIRLYRGTLDVLVNYLKTDVPPPPQLGVGNPALPPDFFYAANDVREWLKGKTLFEKVTKRSPQDLPSIDLSRAELHGLPWEAIDFSWLSARVFQGVDLRHANLARSEWAATSLQGSHLQCANLFDANFEAPRAVRRRQPNAKSDFTDSHLQRAILKEAHLRNAVLVRADLSGADLTDADLRDADLTGAVLTGADLTGAKFASGALDDAIGREEAYGVSGQPQSPPDFEVQRQAECRALLAGEPTQ